MKALWIGMKFRFVKVLTFKHLIQFSPCVFIPLFFKILENITPNKVNKARFQYIQPRLTVFTCGTKAKENWFRLNVDNWQKLKASWMQMKFSLVKKIKGLVQYPPFCFNSALNLVLIIYLLLKKQVVEIFWSLF